MPRFDAPGHVGRTVGVEAAVVDHAASGSQTKAWPR